jgi:hypothetical protein
VELLSNGPSSNLIENLQGEAVDTGQIVLLSIAFVDLAVIAWRDARTRIVPAVLIWPAIAGAFTFRALRGDWLHILAGLVMGGGFALLSLFWGEERAGLGDAEVYGFLGLAIGGLVIYVMIVASLAGLLYGLARRVRSVPVVPFIFSASVLVVAMKLVTLR